MVLQNAKIAISLMLLVVYPFRCGFLDPIGGKWLFCHQKGL
ncbi:hypothetical protein CsSME_00019332 [Camellia sinensis var. sinensis]